jgi:sugar lactone lactonase YvrE
VKGTFVVRLAVTIGLLLQSGSALSQEIYRFERLWPALSQPWYFSEPRGIGRDPAGFVYVLDSHQHTVSKFSSDGSFITKWGARGSGDGEFELPQGIAVDAEGFVYVTDTSNHRIQKFTSDGTFVAKWGRNGGDGTPGSGNAEFGYPHGITLDTEGFIYIADTYKHRIQKLDREGTYITEWGTYGSDTGQFIYPFDLAVGTSNGVTSIYVAEKFNNRIQKFNSVGDFILGWGGNGSDNGKFLEPTGITVDQDGYVYVADTYNHRIQKFDAGGLYITQWGEEGSGDGEFDFLYSTGKIGIEIDSDGYVCVGDHFRIQKFDSSGSFLTSWSSFGSANTSFDSPSGLALGMEGFLYVSDTHNNCVKKFDFEGNIQNFSDSVTTLGICNTTGGTGDGEFKDPIGIALDSEGYIYVVDTVNNRVQKFSSNGQLIGWWGKDENRYTGWHDPGSGAFPNRSGGAENGAFDLPMGIAIDTDGYVYVSDSRNNRIQKFDSQGNYITKWGAEGHGDREFLMPLGIAVRRVNGANFVYVADYGNDRVQKFSSNGTFIRAWGADFSVDGAFYQPTGITVDEAGDIYVSETSVPIGLAWNETRDRIQKFRDDGVSIEFVAAWGSTGSNPGQLFVPYDLAVSSIDGKVFVVERNNNRVQVFTPITLSYNPRAIIVAGRPSAGDSLWESTQVCTNFAYRSLIHQGFTKGDIKYFSAATNLDLDNDGFVDVEDFPSSDNLQSAITGWAVEEQADQLILYLNDHGGTDTFRYYEGREGDDGILHPDTLATWLDTFQTSTSGKVTVIYEACKSGSFINELEGNDRIIITSTLPEEQAKFLNNGTLSFSGFFWTNIFNGSSIGESFDSASEGVTFSLHDQNPQINVNGIQPLRGEVVQDVYLGNGMGGMLGSAPEIESYSGPQEITLETSVELFADGVRDEDGIARVWAVIWPPHYESDSNEDPLLTLPKVELLPEGENRYAGTCNEFRAVGIYQVAIYAMDRHGNISPPHFTTVAKNLTRQAIIVAGGSGSGLSREMIEQNAGLAYTALISQGYTQKEIYFMSEGMPNSDEEPSFDTLETSFESLINGSMENVDLTLYLIGEGDTETFAISDTDTLDASTLAGWLNDLCTKKSCRTTLMYDGNKSGSFIPVLYLPNPVEGRERILITSAGEDTDAYFRDAGNICFSYFFWSKVSSGVSLYDAFENARSAISYYTRMNDISFTCYKMNSPLLEADGNSTANQQTDKEIAGNRYIGTGMKFADDPPPNIGDASVEVNEGAVTIVAENISYANELQRVWAVIKPIGYCPESSGDDTQVLTEISLEDPDEYGIEDGRYEGTYNNPIDCFNANVYAMDVQGNTSLPKETKIYQSGGDIYEPDDTRPEATVIVVNHPTPQPHTFHTTADEDWVTFYGQRNNYYKIVARNLDPECEPFMELYYENELIPRMWKYTTFNNTISIEFLCADDGIYYVHLYNGTGCEHTSYDLKVFYPVGRQVLIAGRVIDRKSRAGIDGASIKTGVGGIATSVGGGYELWQIPGTCTIEASAPGYTHYSDTVVVGLDDEFIAKDILMTPTSTPTTTTTTTTTTVDCISDADCDDGLYCNGEESCDQENGVCVHSGDPCTDSTEVCDEDNDECVTPPEPSILLRPDFCFQSRWIPLPVFIRIEGTDTLFNTATEVHFNPKSSIVALQFLTGKQSIFLIGLMMPSWLAPVDTIEVRVKVTPGSEEMSELLTVNLLSLILDEGNKILTR